MGGATSTIRPTLNMKRGMADCVALSFLPFAVPRHHGLFPTLTICADAAHCSTGFLVGLFSPTVGARVIHAPPSVLLQQEAELFAIDCATRLMVRLGWRSGHYVGDNLGALFLLLSFRPPLRNSRMVQTLRRIYNRLLWSRLQLQVSWAASALQPADPFSRVVSLGELDIAKAWQSAMCRWHALLDNRESIRHMGFVGFAAPT